MYEASKLIMWLRQFLTELGYPPPTPTTLFEDDKSAIQIVHNNNDRGRTKHMDVRCHLIRELVKNNITVVQYKPTVDMVADILTKPLDPKLFIKPSTHIDINLGQYICIFLIVILISCCKYLTAFSSLILNCT